MGFEPTTSAGALPTKLKRQLTPRSRLESWFPLSLGLAQRTLLTNGIRVRDVKYTWPGSSWRPSACEADVIATRPQVLLKLLKENCCKVWRLPNARHSWCSANEMFCDSLRALLLVLMFLQMELAGSP